MLHSGQIGVAGKAPDQLEWRRPALMEEAVQRSAQNDAARENVFENAAEEESEEIWLPAGYRPEWGPWRAG
jgi:hypothetical protein